MRSAPFSAGDVQDFGSGIPGNATGLDERFGGHAMSPQMSHSVVGPDASLSSLIETTTTFFARFRNAILSATARLASRVSFQAITMRSAESNRCIGDNEDGTSALHYDVCRAYA
jgi:hypothetical protein